MKINSLEREEVFLILVTSENGITEDEARRRLSEFGYNEIKETGKIPLHRRFLRQFTHFLAILLWIAAGLSFFSECLNPGEGMVTLGVAITGVIVINAFFTFLQEYRAEKSIEKLRLLLPFRVKVIRNGKEREIDSRELVPGDLIILSEGDKIPADARVIESSSLMVNRASLTGESEPVLLTSKPCEGELIDSNNIVFAGTVVEGGSGKAVVFSTGMRTEFGRIAHLTGVVEPGLTILQKEVIRLTRIIALMAGAMGITFFIAGYIIGRTFWENFIFAIGIIVANVPEGLLPTVTLTLAMAGRRMAERKVIIKTLNSVEALGSITVICTDKTGTLTENRMEVKEVWTEGNENILKRICILCNNARYIDGHYRGDSTEIAILKYAIKEHEELRSERIMEIPFDPERMRMTTVDRVEGEIYVHVKGALENILSISDKFLVDGKNIPLDDGIKDRIIKMYYSMMDKGLRVLAFAYKGLKDEDVMNPVNDLIEKDLVFAGMLGLEDPPRPEVPYAVRRCREAGIKIIMITGDAGRTAVAVASKIGLIERKPVLIEGHELIRMGDNELRERLREDEVIFARMTPRHKLRIVTVLKEMGEMVAVTGDGVNDAPALKKADVGIAMGISGTDVARESADMIIMDDNFATIVNGIEEGRGAYENIRKFINYIFSSNIPEIVPYLMYVLFRIPLPLNIMQILAVDLGTDMFPALSLGAEKPTFDVMKKPPRSPQERLLNKKILMRSYLFLGLIEAFSAMYIYFYVLKGGGWSYGDMLMPDDPLYLRATTACLSAIVVTQIGNLFACRSFSESVFSIGFFSNPLIFLGIGMEILIILFIVYHPLGNIIFMTSPLPGDIWFLLIPFAFILLFLEELRKFIVRRFLSYNLRKI